MQDIHGKKINRYWLMITLMFGTFCTALTTNMLVTAYPTLMNRFNISSSTVQWLTTGFLLVMGIMIPISAWLINNFSLRTIYLAALTFFLGGLIISYTATSFSLILVGRLVQAIGVGITFPTIQTVLLVIFPADKRGTMMGLGGVVIGLAPALGPTLSGWILDNATWRDLFGLMIPPVILVIVLTLIFIYPVIPLKKSSIDKPAIVLSTIGFGSLLYGFSSVGENGWLSATVIGGILVGHRRYLSRSPLHRPLRPARVAPSRALPKRPAPDHPLIHRGLAGHRVIQHGHDWHPSRSPHVLTTGAWLVTIPFWPYNFTRSIGFRDCQFNQWFTL